MPAAPVLGKLGARMRGNQLTDDHMGQCCALQMVRQHSEPPVQGRLQGCSVGAGSLAMGQAGVSVYLCLTSGRGALVLGFKA